MNRLLPILAIAAALALAAPPALACSCLPPQATAAQLAAEGVRIVRGRVIGVALEDSAMSVRYRIAVAERVNLGPVDEIEVRTASQSAACGVALSPGEKVVLRLGGDGPIYGINLCSQISLGDPDWDAFFERYGR